MRLVSLLAVGAVLLISSPLERATARTSSHAVSSSTFTTRARGTAIVVDQRPVGAAVVLRINSSEVRTIVLGRHSRIITRDAHPIPASAIRPGDTITVQGRGWVKDLSQATENVRGVVVVGSVEANDPIIVQSGGSMAILADTGTRTQYSDPSHQTSSVAQLEDGDLVQLRGIVDSELGEMTRTDGVSRLGPYPRKTPTG